MESVEKIPFRELYYWNLYMNYDVLDHGAGLSSEPIKFIQLLFNCISKSDNLIAYTKSYKWIPEGIKPYYNENRILELTSVEDKELLFNAKHDFIMSCLNKANVTDFKPLNVDEYFTKPDPENPEN
ncbi:hypothetical protein [Aquirufa nivalisilvae]|uniref:hypothetical protein n=1 Tax=Aquirufa nivalisilvae TaxID=2516557 RepID=UPI0022A91E36|nr:hypothetical protein [Aquirufa nivalisilvae]MCZ2480054.1 hypothetical protein [Aquirufa nivalisilvae]